MIVCWILLLCDCMYVGVYWCGCMCAEISCCVSACVFSLLLCVCMCIGFCCCVCVRGILLLCEYTGVVV